MEEKDVILTQEGYDNLDKELNYLKTEKRAEIADRIKVALGFGDLSENSEYDEAKTAQAENEVKIAELENKIRHAKIIDEKEIDTDTVQIGNTVCTDCFDVYMTDVNKFLSRVPDNFNPISAEMEAFALFYNAKLLNKKASCLMSVVDSKYITEIATPEERQTGLNTMIKLALDSAIQL